MNATESSWLRAISSENSILRSIFWPEGFSIMAQSMGDARMATSFVRSACFGASALIGLLTVGNNAAAQSPDLVVTAIMGPSPVNAGQQVTIEVEARNTGDTLAPGSSPGTTGYMVDLVLSQDQVVPPGGATVSTTFLEDALLVGGRISNTVDLAPGASATLSEGQQVIPADTPPGAIFLCARIDPFNAVAETNEDNNVTCRRIVIRPSHAGGPRG
jgi:hypothetical protein